MRTTFVLISIVVLFAPQAGAAPLQTIALTGQAAPGTPSGVTFGTFGSPYDVSIPRPQVDDGNVLFFAFLNGPGVDGLSSHGLWSFDGTNLDLVARAGDAAPGTGEGVVFFGLPNDIVPLGFDLAGGTAFLPATLRGPGVGFNNDDGLWRESSGNLSLLLREGDAAPGTGAAFSSLRFVDFSAAGSLLFSRLSGASVGDDDESVWTTNGTSLVLRAREGDTAPGTSVRFGLGDTGATPDTFSYADWNDSGQLVLQADLAGPRVDSYNDEALFIDRGNGLELYLREGDPAPGAGRRTTFGGSSVALGIYYPRINALGHVAFPIRLGGKKTGTKFAIYSDHRGALAPVAIVGESAPGTGRDWVTIAWPVLSDGGHIAFTASVDPGYRPRTGIFWDQRGTIEPVLLPDDAVPDRPGLTVFDLTSIVGYTASGNLVFTGHLADASSITVTGLLAATPDGTVQTLAAGRDIVEVAPGDRREVQSVHAGEVGEDGTVSLRLVFRDGSSGVFALHLP